MPGEYFVWSAEGQPVTAMVNLALVDRLAALIHHERESFGVLLGSVRSRGKFHVVYIDDFEPLNDSIAALAPLRDRQPVGLFRSKQGSNFRLDESDAQAIERLFHSPELVYLLIQPEAGAPARAGFFIVQEGGQVHGFMAYREFPFHARLLREGFPISNGRDLPVTAFGGMAAHARSGAIITALTVVALTGWALWRSAAAPPSPPASPVVAAVNVPAPAASESKEPSAPEKAAAFVAEPAKPAPTERRVAQAPSVSMETVPPGRVKKLFAKMTGRKRYIQARAVSRPLPKLPRSVAASIGADTPVDLRLKVDRDGRVRESRVITASHYPELARLTANTAEKWRFEPARIDGRPVASDVILHFRYRLP